MTDGGIPARHDPDAISPLSNCILHSRASKVTILSCSLFCLARLRSNSSRNLVVTLEGTLWSRNIFMHVKSSSSSLLLLSVDNRPWEMTARSELSIHVVKRELQRRFKIRAFAVVSYASSRILGEVTSK
eukprot:Blabericola_migrator_1__4123@NODE_2259_length_3044_cov_11_669802_g617_i3_p2_GENE_NODE_2259_length_3044_cov_11_669802_g617_i3NODE_2259_length_3044_cov_11_669802_g617_i3_p2_ORF_typecomplete_len129_score6_01DNA_mis_repair/PF01119_19/0_12_NODE_2259_length_3044_cov_11_669802_g617_i319682354